MRQASGVIRRIKPEAVVGFGGYPTLPPLYAATRRKVPTLIHEQNAVMGRANKALASRVSTRSPAASCREAQVPYGAKTVVTGNPVRPAVLEAARTPYHAVGSGRAVPAAGLRRQPGRAVLLRRDAGGDRAACRSSSASGSSVTQQARAEDVGAGQGAPTPSSASTREVSPFFTDMAERIAARASGHLALRRLDRFGDRRDRPAGAAGALSATRSTTTRRPMPQRLRRPAAPRCIRSRRCRRSGSPTLIGGLMDDPDTARRPWRRPPNRRASRTRRGCSPT